jgi:hypothetical protein
MKEAIMMDHIIDSKSFKTLSLSSAFLAIFLISPLSMAVPDSNADINGDAFTNSLDISKLSSCYGQNPMSNSECASADVNEDGDIDVDDFSFVSDRFGDTYPWILYSSPIVNLDYRYGVFKQLGDINNDGVLDVLTLQRGLFTLWLGNGDSSFREQQSFHSGFNERLFSSFAIEDVNADNILDLVGIDTSGVNIAVRIGNGNGSFQAPRHYAAGNVNKVMCLSDVNGDDKLDVLVSNIDSSSISVLFGNGEGSFQESQHFYSCSSACEYQREFGDVNGDGIVDAVHGNWLRGYFEVELGNEDGSFREHQSVRIGLETYLPRLGDLNGDGTLDAAVPYWDGVAILLNQGDGTFHKHHHVGTGDDHTQRVSLSDVSGDGSLDLLSSGRFSDFVSVAINEGDGSFQNPQKLVFGSGYSLAHSGDVNGDGFVDVVVNHSRRTIATVLGNGDGTFQIPMSLETGDDIASMALNDVNRDGTLDILGTNPNSNSIFVLTSNGNGDFDELQNYPAGDHPTSISLGDVNGDGNLDGVVSSSENDSISVLLGNENGSFQELLPALTADAPDSLSLGDLNGDNQLDGVFIESDNISVTLGNGDGSFQEQQHYTAGSSPVVLLLDDVNGDGHLDTIAVNHRSDDVSVLLGNGDGSFQTQRRFDVGNNPGSARLGDLNKDDKLDIVVTNYHGSNISVLLGNGDGSFQTQRQLDAGHYPESLSLGDVNGDSTVDVVIANGWVQSDGISLLLGNGDGSFQDRQSFTENTFSRIQYDLTLLLGDINGDGRLDVVTSKSGGSTVNVLFNRGHL